MADAARSRPFSLHHQRVVLDLDFAGVIKATTWLHIRPIDASLKTVFVHAAPNLRISSCHLSAPATDKLPALPSLPASFVHTNPLASLSDDKLRSIEHHPAIKRRLWTALAEKEEGELAINVSHGWVRLDEVAYDSRRAETGPREAGLEEIVVKIEYEIVGGLLGEGVVFRRPGDGGIDRIPHIFLNSSSYDAARHWIPCLDNLWDRCTWEMEVITPRFLEMEKESSDGWSDEGGQDGGESSTGQRKREEGERVVVVASGELEEQVVHPTDPSKIIFSYSQPTPTSAQHMSFAAGPFVTYVIPSLAQHLDLENEDEDDTQPILLAFCLPGYEVELENSTTFMRQAMKEFSTLGSYPFSTFKMVFVDEPSPQCAVSAGMTVCSSDLLYPREVIDQAFITRPILSHALASQWMGINIIPRTYADLWLVNGLASYINSFFLRTLMGNSEYRYKLRIDIEKCVAMDQGEQYPISVPGARDPPDPPTLEFINLKAPLVLQMLDRRMTKLGTSLGLSRVLPKLFLESLSGQLKDNQLSSAHFLKTCRKLSGVDWTSFHEQWVLGSGCPQISVSARYDRPRKLVDFIIKQSIAAPKASESRRNMMRAQWQKPTQQFEGPLTIRIYEDDDAPYEHVLDVPSKFSRNELPYVNKFRRVGGWGGRKKVADNGDLREDDEAPDVGADANSSVAKTGRALLEERMTHWTEADKKKHVDQGFEYIRVDPDCEWLAVIRFEPLSINRTDKPGVQFFAQQLARERDVVGQKEAIDALVKYRSPRVPVLLYDCLRNENYFYRIRMAAAEALLQCDAPLCTADAFFHENCQRSRCSSTGAYMLLRYYCDNYLVTPPGSIEDPFSATFHPRANDFRRPAEYFVLKAVISSIAFLRSREGRTLYASTKLLVSAAMENNNGSNTIADGHYLATLAAALGTCLRSNRGLLRAEEIEEVSAAVDRLLALDRLLPSFGNVVTIAGLQTSLQLQYLARGSKSAVFLAATRDGNYLPLRVVAMDCFMASEIPTPAVLEYCNHIMTSDSSLQMRRHVAQVLPECWLAAFGRGVVNGLHQAVSILEANANPTQRANKQMQEDIQCLRDMLQADLFAKTIALGNLLTPSVDLEIRLAMLTTLNLMHAGKSEDPAKLRLTLTGNSPVSVRGPTLSVRPGAIGAESPKGLTLRLGPSLERKDATAIEVSLNVLYRDPRSVWFREPVSEVDAPSYYNVIKRPMDLATIRDKLKKKRYKARQEYVQDMKLLFSNALSYNNPGDPVHDDAMGLREAFRKSWAKLESTIVAAANSPPGPPAIAHRKPSLALPSQLLEPVTTPGPRIRLLPPRPMDPPSSTLPVSQTPRTFIPPKPLVPTSRALFSTPTSTPTIKLGRQALVSSVPGKKRKHDVEEITSLDDELLDIADGKAEKVKRPKGNAVPAVAGPSAPAIVSTPKVSLPKLKKLNKGTPSSSRTSTPAPPVQSDVNLAVSTPSRTSGSPAVQSTKVKSNIPYRVGRAKQLIKVLATTGVGAGETHVFWDDPTPVLINYLTVVQKPMYMKKIDSRIQKGVYKTAAELAGDIELMFANSRAYNGPESDFVKSVLVPTENLFHAEWVKFAKPEMNGEEKRALREILGRIGKMPEGGWFMADIMALDPALNYFETIPRQNARDIPMILRRLSSNPLPTDPTRVYQSEADVDADFYMMLNNAQTFNRKGDPAWEAAKVVGEKWDAERRKMEPGRVGKFA